MKPYRIKGCILIIVSLSLALPRLMAGPAGTAFSYQGRLANGANATSGLYDFKFSLWDAAGAGANLIGATQTISSVTVATGGLFTAFPDFGAAAFNGNARWLELAVRTNGAASFTVLSPRQNLTPEPYAITASNLSGTLAGGQLTGTLPSALLSGTYGSALNLNNAANSFTGSGAGLTGINAATLGGLGAGSFWKLLGNAGTTAGVNFLGTTDNQPLELKANNQRVFRLEPTTESPNLIGGFSGNIATAGVVGATIAGGGGPYQFGPDKINRVAADFGSIGGGESNAVEAASATIGGGEQNGILGGSDASVIGGGEDNAIQGNSDDSTIGGGGFNSIGTGSYNSTIGGGANNMIQTGSDGSTIGGGHFNHIQSFQPSATIAGGSGNTVLGGGAGTVGGGGGNSATNSSATVAGGSGNVAGGQGAFVGGGGIDGVNTAGNLAQGAASAIAGGIGNLAGGGWAAIAGGASNSALGGFSALGGGSGNGVTALTTYGVVGGGSGNVISQGNADTIGGGYLNRIFSDAATIAGGQGNYAGDGLFVTVGGGGTNSSSGRSSTIAGGENNNVGPGTSDSTIGGGLSNSVFPGNTGATIAGGIANRVDTASLNGPTLGGGKSNLVSNSYGTIPGGFAAKVSNYGQMAYASGAFATAGDAQTSVYVCRGTTSSAAQGELFLDGVSQRMSPPSNSTWTMDILVTGRDSAGHSVAFSLLAGAENQAGITVLMGAAKKTVIAKDAAGATWDVNLSAPGTNGAFQIVVNGAAGTSIRWLANVRTAELSY